MNGFDPVTHTYTIDGRKVPSVTQVLNDLLPCFQASEWHLQRGTAVHACAAMIARGVEFEHDQQIDGQVRACKRFFAEVKPIVFEVERQVYCAKYGYAGTFDIECCFENRVCLVDWKASFSASLPYQLAAYAMAYEDMGANPIRFGYGVQLCEDGFYHMSETYDLRRYKTGFLNLLSAYNIRRECKVNEERVRE